MVSMTYFTAPSTLAYVLLLAGLGISILALSATMNTISFRPGSPATVADPVSHRVASYIGAVLMTTGAVPLLFAPVQDLLALAAR
jgi:hypothetical protein